MINFIKKWFMCKEIRSKTVVLYFQRYRIIETPWFGVFIHYIERSDEDKDPHNHPWNFFSIILRGSYTEDVYGRALDYRGNKWSRHKLITKRRGFLSCAFRSAQFNFHKIAVHSPVWTLVFTGPRLYNKWGYLTESEFIDFDIYRKLKNTPPIEQVDSAQVEEIIEIPKTKTRRKTKANYIRNLR